MEKASAENPKLNGAAEAAIKTVKNIYKKSWMNSVSKEEALFLLHATPRHAGSLSPMRLFHNHEIRIPQLLALPDLRDEQAYGEAVNKEKFHKKAKANERIEKFDTSPLELTVGLQVVMRDAVSKRWEIPATMVRLGDRLT